MVWTYVFIGSRIHITALHSLPEISFTSITSFQHFDGLVQDCSNSSALAMELLQSCTKASIWYQQYFSMVHKPPPCLISHCYHFPHNIMVCNMQIWLALYLHYGPCQSSQVTCKVLSLHYWGHHLPTNGILQARKVYPCWMEVWDM